MNTRSCDVKGEIALIQNEEGFQSFDSHAGAEAALRLLLPIRPHHHLHLQEAPRIQVPAVRAQGQASHCRGVGREEGDGQGQVCGGTAERGCHAADHRADGAAHHQGDGAGWDGVEGQTKNECVQWVC